MQEKLKELASRIHELREISEINNVEMANMLNVPVEKYKAYESGMEDIPASVLYEISHILKVDMSTLLTGEEPRMRVFTITRAGKGVSVERRKQYHYENLVEKFIRKKAEFFIVTVEPNNNGRPHMNAHPGHEFNYVLEGSIKVYLYNNEIVLGEGDSIYFDSGYDHAMEALDGRPARFLACIL
ncbi:MAG TPA: cupin domain-containing protein [Candidatus Methanofastidiosa archaeon]|nr:cupin domain-containing protein [Candidatus Methanofastidiosa archaeon]HPR42318.1 cupin domain-containing protein [Candidatus Methanofastidiosa archaeon]